MTTEQEIIHKAAFCAAEVRHKGPGSAFVAAVRLAIHETARACHALTFAGACSPGTYIRRAFPGAFEEAEEME